MMKLVVFCLTFAMAVMPAFSIKKDTKLILAELQKIQEMTANLDQKVTILSTEYSSLAKKVKMIDEKVSALTRNQADSRQNSETLVINLQFLKEEINELKNSVNTLNNRLQNSPPANSNEGGTSSETEGSPPPEQKPVNFESVYYTAYSDYMKKNYDLAIGGFKQFIRLFPDNGLADNSLYWIGECYYSQKKYEDAVKTFSELIEKYGDGDKIPDATLKKGYSLIEMGKSEEGVTALRGLISKFPFTEAASLAKQKIKEIEE